MIASGHALTAPDRWVSPRLILTINSFGAHLAGGLGHDYLPLGIAELSVLHAVADPSVTALGDRVGEIAARFGDDPAELSTFVDELESRGLVRVDLPPRAIEVTDPAAAPSPAPLEQLVTLDTPVVLRVGPLGYELVGHDGEVRARFDVSEVAALTALAAPATLERSHAQHLADAGPLALDAARFAEIAGRAVALGIALTFEPGSEEEERARGLTANIMRRDFAALFKVKQAIAARSAQHSAAEAEREAATGRQRVRVVPVTFNGSTPPIALGLIIAYAKVHAGGKLEEEYDFRPEWIVDDEILTALADRPGVFLFSNYVWSYKQCIAASELIKRISPQSVTIHGGPSTPKYDADVERYFEQHPHVDIAVRGEGEATAAAVLEALIGVVGRGDGPPDLSVLRDVEGIAFRDGDEIVRTPDRERIADLDMIPSPWLTGLFDAYGEVPDLSVTIETNRGCPYGCTFCDWGAATMSRIRKFSLDRVLAELEWLAEHRVRGMGPADANFGIWERDVAIAAKVAELKQTVGYPKVFGANYAKNTAKHLRQIIEILVGAGILSHGIVSLQSMDADTLDAIDRSNIKLEKYEELATTFRKQKLPLFVDLMVGLPGQTPTSFAEDLQQCIDREVQVRIPITELLANSPMNAPSYREKWKIEVDAPPGDLVQTPLVISTSTFTRTEYEGMRDLRRVFLLCEDFGVLRQISRYVRHETGIREIDLYQQLRTGGIADPDRYPWISLALQVTPDTMSPPVSWAFFIDDLHRYLTTELGVADDDALATVLSVQHHLLPARDRRLPVTIELPHDYCAWFAAVMVEKDAGNLRGWTDAVPALRTFGPGSLTISDPGGMATMAVGLNIESHGFGASWEFDTPVARPFFAGDRAPGLLTV